MRQMGRSNLATVVCATWGSLGPQAGADVSSAQLERYNRVMSPVKGPAVAASAFSLRPHILPLSCHLEQLAGAA